MEMIERFTIDGTPTGESIPRDRAHAEGIPHCTAHVWIINSNNDILMQKRAACKESHPNLWDVSSAGHIPFGESAVNSAVRECEEEIGITVDPSDLVHSGRVYQEYFNNTTGFFDREWVELFILRRDLKISDCTVQVEEVSEVRWFSFDSFVALFSAKSPELVDHHSEYQYLISQIRTSV